ILKPGLEGVELVLGKRGHGSGLSSLAQPRFRVNAAQLQGQSHQAWDQTGSFCLSIHSCSNCRIEIPSAPSLRAALTDCRIGSRSRLSINSLIGPIEAGPIDSRVMPTAISASASSGLPASSPHMVIGIL